MKSARFYLGPGIKMVRISYRSRRVPRSSTLPGVAVKEPLRCLAAQDQIGETTRRHPGQEWFPLGLPKCRLRNSLSYGNPMKEEDGRREREYKRTPILGGAILSPRRFCGFAKSGELRDPEAPERLAQVKKSDLSEL
jgi:hypothetical protein